MCTRSCTRHFPLEVYTEHGEKFKDLPRLCRCSKIMSPPNCNETLSPSQDGDDESEGVPTSESD